MNPIKSSPMGFAHSDHQTDVSGVCGLATVFLVSDPWCEAAEPCAKTGGTRRNTCCSLDSREPAGFWWQVFRSREVRVEHRDLRSKPADLVQWDRTVERRLGENASGCCCSSFLPLRVWYVFFLLLLFFVCFPFFVHVLFFWCCLCFCFAL